MSLKMAIIMPPSREELIERETRAAEKQLNREIKIGVGVIGGLLSILFLLTELFPILPLKDVKAKYEQHHQQ